MNDLMADAAWTRRLATALLGDPEAAADVRQDVWVRTRGEGPRDADSPRAWFRSVVTNALRSQRRSQLRRRSREQVALAANDVAPSPEELLARVEVQRIIAGLVTALEEPGRQLILLRYYEGMSSTQIAATTGEPPGTVRWRLRNALAELRTQLEKHYGERGQSWRRVLLPLAPAPASAPTVPPIAGKRSPALLWGAAAVGALIVLVGVAFRLGAFDRPGGTTAVVSATTEPGAAGAVPDRPRRSGRGNASPPVLSAAVLAGGCPEQVTALEGKVAEARRALHYYLPPRLAYHANGTANPAGLAALAPIMNRWLDEHGAPQEIREMKCQGDACKVKVTEPWPVRAPWRERRPGAKATADLERIARDIVLEGPIEERDEKPSVAETWVWLRLRGHDGRPADAPAPAFPPALLPSGASNVATLPPTASEECRAAIGPLQGEIESLRVRAERELLAKSLYDLETTSNPKLAARLQPLIDRAHRNPKTPEGDRAIPLKIECRGLVCAVRPPDGVAVKSETMKVLMDERELSVQLRRISLDTWDGLAAGPLYFTVMRPPSESRSGGDMLRHFLSRVRHDDVVGRCQARAPGRGKLSFQVLCPAEGESNQDGVPRRISFRLGESLAETPFGRCVAEELTRRAAAFELPAEVTRGEASHTIELP